MKVRASLKSLKNKSGSQVVRRRGRVYVINKKNPRFKGRQDKAANRGLGPTLWPADTPSMLGVATAGSDPSMR